MSASSAPAPGSGGRGARRCGAVPCSWASCGTAGMGTGWSCPGTGLQQSGGRCSSSLKLVVQKGKKQTPPVWCCRRNNCVLFRSLRILCQLRRKLSQHKCTSSPQQQQKLRAQVKAEVLSILMDTADLSNAIHWLPPGFLWAGKFPPWLVGLLGTISSLIGIYQASKGANSEAA